MRRRAFLAAASAGLASLAGCGSYGDGGAGGGDTTTETTGTTETTTTTAASSIATAREAYPDYTWSQLEGSEAVATATVTLQNVAFDPLVATVRPGTTVTFENRDGFGHTVTIPALDVDASLGGGATTTVTVESSGEYGYVCTAHPPDMLGKVVVSEDAPAAATTETTTTTTEEDDGGGYY